MVPAAGHGPSTPALFRLPAIGALAGTAAGITAAAGSRVAMRISAAVAHPALSEAGVRTENGNVVGVITVGGTLGLMLFGTILTAGAGLLYLALRRWLPGPPVAQGLAFGGILWVLLSGIGLDPENGDFRLLDPVWLNVLMFSLLYLLYGVAVAGAASALERRLPREADAAYAVIGVLGLLALIPLGMLTFALVPLPAAATAVLLFAYAAAAPLLDRRLGSRSVRATGYVLLALALGVGAWVTADGVQSLLVLAVPSLG